MLDSRLRIPGKMNRKYDRQYFTNLLIKEQVLLSVVLPKIITVMVIRQLAESHSLIEQSKEGFLGRTCLLAGSSLEMAIIIFVLRNLLITDLRLLWKS